MLSGKALYEGECHPVTVRLAERDDTLILDLGDDTWQAVEIDETGWRLVPSDQVPVKFRRPKGMLALPLPIHGGSLHALDRFMNVADENDSMLVKGWLLGVFCLNGGRAILELLGEQGSSKSTFARMLRKLVDPCSAPLRAAPREERDLLIAANNGLVVAFDNLSELKDWLSDAFCRLSTGGGIGGRQLYTDLDEVVLDAQRPVLLTGINGVATRSDMLDRTISLTLPPITADQRRTESDLWTDFDRAVPEMLGGLLEAVSTALTHRGHVRLERAPRLADFVTWVEAGAPALGWQPRQFAAVFQASRRDLDAVAIDSEPIGPAILALMERQEEWLGTATELLAKLAEVTTEEVRKDRSWPRSASQVGKQLDRIAPNMRRLGIGVQRTRTGSGGTRYITLTRAGADMRQSCQTRQHGGRDRVVLITTDATDRTDTSDAQHALIDNRDEPGLDRKDCLICGVDLPPGRLYDCEECEAMYR